MVQDFFEIVAPATSEVRLREIKLGQYTDFGDAHSDLVSVVVRTGYTSPGSGGTTIAPVKLGHRSNAAPTAGSTVIRNKRHGGDRRLAAGTAGGRVEVSTAGRGCRSFAFASCQPLAFGLEAPQAFCCDPFGQLLRLASHLHSPHCVEIEWNATQRHSLTDARLSSAGRAAGLRGRRHAHKTEINI
jgi:hypothetical protein